MVSPDGTFCLFSICIQASYLGVGVGVRRPPLNTPCTSVGHSGSERGSPLPDPAMRDYLPVSWTGDAVLEQGSLQALMGAFGLLSVGQK